MHLTEDEVVNASEFIFDTAKQMHVDHSQAMTDLAEYCAKHGLWAKKFVWASTEHVLPHVWWTVYDNIHTAKRNRLSNKTAGKLVYVHHNLKHINDNDQLPVDNTFNWCK